MSGKAPEGLLAEWDWDGTTLAARTDRYGLHPLYYFDDGSHFAIATNPLKLLASGFSSPIDYGALGLYLRMGNLFGGDTLWTKIKAIPPNSVLTATASGVRIAGGTIPCPTPITNLSRDEAIDGFIERVRGAVQRRLPKSDNWVHPLSGGRDSRHLLLELGHQGYKPREVVTWAPYIGGGGREADAAAGVAEALGISHTRLSPSRSFTAYEFDKNLDTGFCAPDHFFFIPLREYLQGRTDCVHDGIAGDVLSQDSFLTPRRREMFAEGRFRDLALDHFATLGMAEDSLRWLVGDEVYRKMPIESAIAKFVESCEPFRGESRGYTLWTFFTRTTRMVGLAPFHIFRETANVYAPYLDRDVFDFMTAIPIEHVCMGNFHDEAIARAFPNFSHLPYAQSPSGTVKYQLSATAHLATLRDLFSMSSMNSPSRLPPLARWAMSPILKGPASGVPRKWMTWWLQFEAMMLAGLGLSAPSIERPPRPVARPITASLGLMGGALGACDLVRVLEM